MARDRLAFLVDQLHVLVEGPGGAELEGHVDCEADFDGEFVLTELSSGERLSVKGWMVERMELLG